MQQPKFPADRKRSHAVIEQEARGARHLMGFDDEEPVCGLQVFERLERLRTGRRYEIPTTYLVEPLVAGVEGETRYNQRDDQIEVVLPEATYLDLSNDQPRAAYTVVHETGHVVQHYDELVRLSRIPRPAAALMRGGYASLKPFEDVEWQANSFAAAYLAPAAGLRRLEMSNGLSRESVMRRFGLSPQAASSRLATFGRYREQLIGRNGGHS